MPAKGSRILSLSLEDWLRSRTTSTGSCIAHVRQVSPPLLLVGGVASQLPGWLIVGRLKSELSEVSAQGLASRLPGFKELPGLLQRSSLRLRTLIVRVRGREGMRHVPILI